MLQKQLTYNAVKNRLKAICNAHKLIKAVYYNRFEELLEDKNVKYPSVFINAKGGTIAPGRHDSSLDFRMFIIDRTFLSADSTENEEDVVSDCIGIANDLVAQFVRSGDVNKDWIFNPSSNFEIVIEKTSDVAAGIVFDFTIRVLFYQNVCAVPSDIPIDTDDMKEVYDIYWIAPIDILDNTYTFVVPDDVKNKKILHVIRANFPLFRTATSEIQTTEYNFDGTSLTFGTPIQPLERTLILYRQY